MKNAGHRAFMRLVKTDRRYRADRRYVFTATVLPASAVLAAAAAAPSGSPATARPRASSTEDEAAPSAPRNPGTPSPKHLGLGAAILAAVGAAAHWLDGHPLVTVGAVVVAALLVLLVLDHIHNNKGD